MFALKIWPWPSSNWWITDVQDAQTDDLEAKIKAQFRAFLLTEAGMFTEDWSPPKFRKEVFFLFILTKLLLTTIRKFQAGAQAFRSDIVSVLKQNALSIFEITNIGADDFLDQDARGYSNQLAELREGNAFLSASEEALPGVERIRRYFRSRCIPRVSLFLIMLLYSLLSKYI